MRRGCGCSTVLAILGLALLVLLARRVGWLPAALGAAVVAATAGSLVFALGPHRSHPGRRIGVKSPRSGRRRRYSLKEHPRIIAIVERIERVDPVARRVVETVAVLHTDGVPRWLLRVPEDDEMAEEVDAETAWFLGFAGPAADDVLDRLCDAGLLDADGDLVRMDPRMALAVRVRADEEGRALEVAEQVGRALYAHATGLRWPANLIAFPKAGFAAPDADAVAERVRALLDQAVTLAWHTKYTYDKALDCVLQANACLADLGLRNDARVLAGQMAALCTRRLGPVHPVSRDAVESVQALREG